ncbi:MAG TPA: nucleotidyltransferase domain-containing protein, partial [Trueperaceae bacterium]|nr:nucleotidyltransferase domain-containing protein [Trueperaceae bacterium]
MPLTTTRPQSWPDCDPDIRDYIDGLCDALTGELAANLVGIYLHGSLALGCYYRPKSDFDVIVVVEEPIGGSQRRAVAASIARLAVTRPTVGFVELSVVTATAARDVLAPM